MDTAPNFPPLHFFPLPLSAPGVFLCSQNNAWVMSALGRRCSVQRFSTNATYNDHVLLPLCTPSTGSTPLENLSAVNRLLPFSQVFTTAALLFYHTDGGSSSSLCSAPQPVGVFRESTKKKKSHTTQALQHTRSGRTHVHDLRTLCADHISKCEGGFFYIS